MNTFCRQGAVGLLAVCVVAAFGGAELQAAPLGTAITYQGQLKQSGVPYAGSADLIFTLYDAATGGTIQGGPVTLTNVTVVNGLFTVQVDFGNSSFQGDARWLDVQVRTPAGSGSYATLSPRQPVTPAPYASFAAAPWVTSGSNISYTAGNVGIGTTVPSGRLHVDTGSNLAMTRTSGRSPIFAAGTGIANAELIVGYVTQAGDYVSSSSVGDSFLFPSSNAGKTYLGRIPGNVGLLTLDNASGRVGIGTTPGPSAELDVNGGPYEGVRGSSSGAIGVHGLSTFSDGVYGESTHTHGVFGFASASTGAVVGANANTSGWGVYSLGNFAATGTKSFQIDHPLDPEHKYLNHYCTEGPEPLNVYRGNVTLDAKGQAWVTLPDYFDQINCNPSYQLTAIGKPAPALHVEKEIDNNRFLIAGDAPGQKVSWRVEAQRHDLFVRTCGAPVEQDKPPECRGKYLQPELYAQPKEKGQFYRPPALPSQNQ